MNVFLKESDFEKFLEIVDEDAEIYQFSIHSFCLMNNRYHILLKTTNVNLSLIMKQINSRYGIYFNGKYKRVGPLWQGRFKSWYVCDANYLSSLIKYIEFNPVKAGLVNKIGEYKWAMSSRSLILKCLNYELIDGVNFSKNLTEEDLDNVDRIYRNKLKIDGNKNAIPFVGEKLDYYFQKYRREKAAVKAIRNGYTQSEVAKYLNLSDAAISKIKRIYNQKSNLFEKLRNKGIFWSFDKEIDLYDMKDNVFIEYLLKYGDFWDIKEAFKLFGKRKVKKVWEKALKHDKRFIKLNVLIARVFLNLKMDAGDFKELSDDRFRKLAT